MKIAIIYESISGNTKKIAEEIQKQAEKEGDVIYFGNSECVIPKANIYFIGSWTDKGNATNSIKEILKKMKNSNIAYFGTAGYKEENEYYKQIFDNIKTNINDSNKILGYFFCQGKMPIEIKKRYENQLKQDFNNKKILKNIENFENALNHPDNEDLRKAKEWSKKMIKNIK